MAGGDLSLPEKDNLAWADIEALDPSKDYSDARNLIELNKTIDSSFKLTGTPFQIRRFSDKANPQYGKSIFFLDIDPRFEGRITTALLREALMVVEQQLVNFYRNTNADVSIVTLTHGTFARAVLASRPRASELAIPEDLQDEATRTVQHSFRQSYWSKGKEAPDRVIKPKLLMEKLDLTATGEA